MGAILERVTGILQRAENLAPLRERVRARMVEGNRTAVLAGLTRDGDPVAPLAPRTAQRRGHGPPRAPRGDSSRIISAYVVTVDVSPAGLTVTGGWPGFEAARYLNAGTSRMPARPAGWRPSDVAWATAELRRHVMGE